MAQTLPIFALAKGPLGITLVVAQLAINRHYTQYEKAHTFAVSCECLEHHTYQKGAPL